MPRQDVPYGGAICRLRERIAEIFDKLGEKLHTINGVPGDGDGNVKIVSGSSAVVINNDPTQNEIEVSLDTSQLPAASVSSVNGQTGAVALDAGDIPTVGGDVQADLQDLANDISGNTAAINAEVLARQNADSALQTNINTVSASLPAAAAAAVAADPTVAQLVVDLGNKVDLTDVSTVETPDTIAKRNGSGRLVAADPASGATDKTLVTANWVSQTGSRAPNNLLHTTGNENKSGIITFARPQEGTWNAHRFYFSATTGGNWYKIAEIRDLTTSYQLECINWVINSGYFNSAKGGVALMSLILPNAGNLEGFIHSYKSNSADIWNNFSVKIGQRSDRTLEIFAKGRDYTAYSFLAYCLSVGARSMSPNECITAIAPSIVPEPQASDYRQLITVTI